MFIFYIVLAALFFYVYKHHKDKFGSLPSILGPASSVYKDPLPDLAQALGLKYEAHPMTESDKKTVMHVNARVYGDYKGVPVEMKWYAHAQQEKAGITQSYAYSYRIEKTTTFTVKNPEHKSFEILPKSDSVVSKATGVAAFDEKLALSGAHIVPKNTLYYFATLGWMDITLKGTSLVFNDSYYEQFKGLAGMKMMTAVHPIYHSTAQKPAIDVESVRKFFDEIVELVKGAALV